MSQPLFSLFNRDIVFSYANMYLPQVMLNDSAVWDNGQITLTDPGGPRGNIFASPDIMSGSSVYMGPPSSPGKFSLTNNAWLIEENSSYISAANITGSGDLTMVNSDATIYSGQGATSETIGLVNNSHLHLGLSPGMTFLSPIDIDSTSSINFITSPSDWASDLTSNLWASMHQGGPPDLISGVARVDSLTPGYAPAVTFQFGFSGQVMGMTISDKPIVTAHS